MGANNSITGSDYIPFDTATATGLRLLNNPKTAYLGRYIIIAINTGLRNSDIIQLTADALQRDTHTVIEKKTGKKKTFAINAAIRSVVPIGSTGGLFITQKNTIVTIQHINTELKKIFSKESKHSKISSHSLRKSFGRRVYENNNESDKALMYLTNLFNHNSMQTTLIYLGIRQQELNDIYLSL